MHILYCSYWATIRYSLQDVTGHVLMQQSFICINVPCVKYRLDAMIWNLQKFFRCLDTCIFFLWLRGHQLTAAYVLTGAIRMNAKRGKVRPLLTYILTAYGKTLRLSADSLWLKGKIYRCPDNGKKFAGFMSLRLTLATRLVGITRYDW